MTDFRRHPLTIGTIELPNPVVLAPMSGVTDAPFRRLVARLGAGLVVSEMTACCKLVEGRRDALLRAEGQGVGVHVVQLAGCEAHWMAEGARIAEGNGAAVIDINMGCPARHVTGGEFGLGADAQSRSRADADRRDGRRGVGAGDAQDAAWLGRPHHQRARARAPRAKPRACA